VVRRLLATYLTITAFVLAVVVVPLGLTFADREHDRLVFDIERDAQAVASLVEDDLEAGTAPSIDAVLADYAGSGGRIVVVDGQGVGLVDSDRPAAEPRDFSTRPEIAAALEGRRATGSRDSETAGTELLFVAVPVASGGGMHGAVRITYPTSAVDARIRSMWLRLGVLCVVVLATVALVGMVLARSVSQPVRRLERAARRLAGGDLSARVGTGDGAPELRALADTFDVMADRLDTLVASQRRFVADASHQLRTPLTALRLRLETLTDDVAPPAGPKLDAALAETERLAALVESLLVLARGDAASVEIGIVDAQAVAEERVASWQPVARERHVEVTVAHRPPAPVRAPAGALEQIFDNLVSNALDVAPPESEVAVRVADEGGAVEVHVTDAGPGMSPEARAHAFERFWRPPGSGGGKGFGLGLAIVDQLARSCGGAARLDPGPDGRGLDAVVRLVPPDDAGRDRSGRARDAHDPHRALTSG
jgi:signal transduction histidine kinase